MLNPFRGLSSDYRLTTVTHNRAKERGRSCTLTSVLTLLVCLSTYREEVMAIYAITVVVRARCRGPNLGYTKTQTPVRDSRRISCIPARNQIVHRQMHPCWPMIPFTGQRPITGSTHPFSAVLHRCAGFVWCPNLTNNMKIVVFFPHSPVFLFPISPSFNVPHTF